MFQVAEFQVVYGDCELALLEILVDGVAEENLGDEKEY